MLAKTHQSPYQNEEIFEKEKKHINRFQSIPIYLINFSIAILNLETCQRAEINIFIILRLSFGHLARKFSAWYFLKLFRHLKN